MIGSFSYKAPKSIEELREMIKTDSDYCILAGGTELMDLYNESDIDETLIIDIKKIESFREINFCPEKGIEIGAAVTMSEIAEYDFINSDFELLADAAWKYGDSSYRNRATIGGRICTTSPYNKISTALLCFDASVKILSDDGYKTIPFSDFIKDYADDSIVCSVIIPDKYCDFSGKTLYAPWNINGSVLYNDSIMRIAVSSGENESVFVGEFAIKEEFDYEKAVNKAIEHFGDFYQEGCEDEISSLKKCIKELVLTACGKKEKISVKISVNDMEYNEEIPVSMSLFHFLKDIAGEAYDSEYDPAEFIVTIDGRKADSVLILAAECNGCNIII